MVFEGSDNIFDLAGKRQTSPVRRKGRIAQPPPTLPSLPLEPPEAETQDQLERIEEMRQKCQELDQRLQQIYDRFGYSPEGIERFLKRVGQNEEGRQILERETKRLGQELAKLKGSQPQPERIQNTKKERKRAIGERKRWLSID